MLTSRRGGPRMRKRPHQRRRWPGRRALSRRQGGRCSSHRYTTLTSSRCGISIARWCSPAYANTALSLVFRSPSGPPFRARRSAPSPMRCCVTAPSVRGSACPRRSAAGAAPCSCTRCRLEKALLLSSRRRLRMERMPFRVSLRMPFAHAICACQMKGCLAVTRPAPY